MKRGKDTSKDSRKENPDKRTTDQAPKMHYASASRARERDQVARKSWRGGRRGMFGTTRLTKLLILIAIGFAAYSFAASRGYLESLDALYRVRESASNLEDIQDMGERIPAGLKEFQDASETEAENEVGDEDEEGDEILEENNEEDMEDDADHEFDVAGQINLKEKTQDQDDKKEVEKNYDHVYKYHVLQTLTNTDRIPHLKTRFEVCMKSILDKSSVDLLFFFVVDGPSKTYLETALQEITNLQISKSKFQFIFLDIDDLAHELAPLVEMMQSKIQGNHPYYKDSIFFLSTMLHMGLLPEYVHHVVMLDTDLKFMSDIKLLFDYFDHFQGDNIMGVVHEQQPVYRHIFSLYRSQNPGTRVGDPPPNGLTGFNSGVLLIDLDRTRHSKSYEEFLKGETVSQLRDKYHFKGHLGDQDFYSLISMEKEDLFYNIPCSWNKQLCIWWKDKGYQNVFDQYHLCNERIHVYHGNCNTPIPY